MWWITIKQSHVFIHTVDENLNWFILAVNLDKADYNYPKTDGESYNYSSFHTAVCLRLHSGPFVVLDKLGSKPQGILNRAESESTSILLLAQS